MKGEKDLQKLLKTMKPKHNVGDYVFCVINDLGRINIDEIVLLFKEVVAAFYHDHIFVAKEDTEKAMEVLNTMKG